MHLANKTWVMLLKLTSEIIMSPKLFNMWKIVKFIKFISKDNLRQSV